MKREYQVKGCIEECEGHVRWAGEGETPQFWGLYQLEDDGICWKWLADFESEKTARQVMKIREGIADKMEGKMAKKITDVLAPDGMAYLRAVFEVTHALCAMAVREADTISFDEFFALITQAIVEQEEGMRLVHVAALRLEGEAGKQVKGFIALARMLGGEA